MTLTRLLILICVALTLTGCGLRERIFGSGGQADRVLPYKAKLARGEDTRDFAVQVQAGGASVQAVRESARFQATRYCLTNFGGADASWQLDPVTGDWAYSRDGGDLLFRGRCVAR